jgi:hypothetical protein
MAQSMPTKCVIVLPLLVWRDMAVFHIRRHSLIQEAMEWPVHGRQTVTATNVEVKWLMWIQPLAQCIPTDSVVHSQQRL